MNESRLQKCTCYWTHISLSCTMRSPALPFTVHRYYCISHGYNSPKSLVKTVEHWLQIATCSAKMQLHWSLFNRSRLCNYITVWYKQKYASENLCADSKHNTHKHTLYINTHFLMFLLCLVNIFNIHPTNMLSLYAENTSIHTHIHTHTHTNTHSHTNTHTHTHTHTQPECCPHDAQYLLVAIKRGTQLCPCGNCIARCIHHKNHITYTHTQLHIYTHHHSNVKTSNFTCGDD